MESYQKMELSKKMDSTIRFQMLYEVFLVTLRAKAFREGHEPISFLQLSYG